MKELERVTDRCVNIRTDKRIDTVGRERDIEIYRKRVTDEDRQIKGDIMRDRKKQNRQRERKNERLVIDNGSSK